MVDTLRKAVRDLSWLRSRGYSEPSAAKLVGDRYQLRGRQRTAVGRCAGADDAVASRVSRRVERAHLAGRTLVIDGLNVLTTLEVAMAGGVLLVGRDGCMRDMASFHGNYRLVHETEAAIDMLLATIEAVRLAQVQVYIDRPVSNSGRLAAAIRTAVEARALPVEPVLSSRVDAALKATPDIAATADSAILDAEVSWFNLARHVIDANRGTLDPLWVLDFEDPAT